LHWHLPPADASRCADQYVCQRSSSSTGSRRAGAVSRRKFRKPVSPTPRARAARMAALLPAVLAALLWLHPASAVTCGNYYWW